MNPHINTATINILNGLLIGTISFHPHLNLISGENGTLKTKLLQTIHQQRPFLALPPGTQPRLQAISPLRNTERRTADSIVQYLRQSNRTYDTYAAERVQSQMVDTQYQPYPSVGELFFLDFDRRSRDGGQPQIEHMRAVADDFNFVIQSVFPEYRLQAEWNAAVGSPTLSVLKGDSNEVPLEALSLGEQEVLSLVTNLYMSREANDVYLVDEPEVHLNWHLEERLFGYFYDFCREYDRQMIVVTHSRIVFTDRFLPTTTFFYWTPEGRVSWGPEISLAQRRRIAGEAIEIIKLGDIGTGTFFVEDRSHAAVVKAIANQEGVEVSTVVCGNSQNVRSFYKRSESDGGWLGAFFLEDGDNQGSPFPDKLDFIHLEKYSIENYLLDLPTASEVTSKTELELRQIIFDEVEKRRNQILGKNKFLDFLFDGLLPEHLTADRLSKLDASMILEGYLLSVGMTFEGYLGQYVRVAKQSGTLDEVFPSSLVEAVREAMPTGAALDS